MKVISVFIFCLFVLSLLVPVVTLAAGQKSVVLNLTIQPRDLLAEVIEMIKNEELIEPIIDPLVLNKININNVEVVSTLSGNLQTGIVLSVF